MILLKHQNIVTEEAGHPHSQILEIRNYLKITQKRASYEPLQGYVFKSILQSDLQF